MAWVWAHVRLSTLVRGCPTSLSCCTMSIKFHRSSLWKPLLVGGNHERKRGERFLLRCHCFLSLQHCRSLPRYPRWWEDSKQNWDRRRETVSSVTDGGMPSTDFELVDEHHDRKFIFRFVADWRGHLPDKTVLSRVDICSCMSRTVMASVCWIYCFIFLPPLLLCAASIALSVSLVSVSRCHRFTCSCRCLENSWGTLHAVSILDDCHCFARWEER